MSVLENQLHLNEVTLAGHQNASARRKRGATREMLLVIGEKAETTQVHSTRFPRLSITGSVQPYPRERAYRAWYLSQKPEQPLFEMLRGAWHGSSRKALAGLPQLPEELFCRGDRTTDRPRLGGAMVVRRQQLFRWPDAP